MTEEIPLYLRGVDRKKAEEIVKLFARSYQPPVTCLHRGTRTQWKMGGIHQEKKLPRFLRWRECTQCGWFEGVLLKTA